MAEIRFDFIRYIAELEPLKLIEIVKECQESGLNEFQEYESEFPETLIASNVVISQETMEFIKDNMWKWEVGHAKVFRNHYIIWQAPEEEE